MLTGETFVKLFSSISHLVEECRGKSLNVEPSGALGPTVFDDMSAQGSSVDQQQVTSLYRSAKI
jgi:hypothetical protein